MNTNEELKTRPDFEALAIDFIEKMEYEGSVCVIVAKHGYKTSYEDCWTTHVEPLQAENKKLKIQVSGLINSNDLMGGETSQMSLKVQVLQSENQKLREALKEVDSYLNSFKSEWKEGEEILHYKISWFLNQVDKTNP